MVTATEFACHAEPPKLGEIVVFTDNGSDAAGILEFAGLLAEENGAFGSGVWSCFRHIRIRSINHHLDRQEEFQPIGNRCWVVGDFGQSRPLPAAALAGVDRFFMNGSGTRDTVFVMSTLSKGAINERGTNRTEEL